MRRLRTTVVIDADLAAELRRQARERGLTFKEALNSTLRRGLSDDRGAPRPFRQPTYAMGLRPGVDLTKALRLAADLEDEEIVRKLDVRK